MDPVKLRNFRDGFVNEAKPGRNYSGLARLRVQADAGSQQQIVMYWGKPMPEETNVFMSTLTLWNAKAFTGSVTLTAQAITEKWAGNKVDWNSKPTTAGDTYQVTQVDAAKNTAWTFDIQDLMQAVSQGAAWYGILITVNGTGSKVFHSSDSPDPEYRPLVLVQWNDDPEPPESLSPDGNRAVSSDKPILTYSTTMVDGDNLLAKHRIQISTDVTFATVDWDSGWLFTDRSEFNLATSTYPGLADGASTYWRVAVEDTAGGQSEFSDPAQFSRATRGVFSVGALTDDGDGTWSVQDTTPTILWSLTGRTQSAYRVRIELANEPDVSLYDSGRLTGTENSISTGGSSERILRSRTELYRLIVWVWDDISREKTPGDEVFYYYSQVFNYSPGAIAAPTSVVATLEEPWPWVMLDFDIATIPDGITIFRDDEVIAANLDPADLWQGGTSYKYRDRTAPPRVSHEWEIVANRNGEDSPPSTSVSTQTMPHYTWLMNLDGSSPIVLAKAGSSPTPAVEATSQSFQEVHHPVGGPPVLISQYISGYEGRVDAILADGIVPGLSARDMRDRLKKLKKNPGTEVYLYMVDEVLKVVPLNITYRPRAKGGGKIFYDIGFDFFQVDY